MGDDYLWAGGPHHREGHAPHGRHERAPACRVQPPCRLRRSDRFSRRSHRQKLQDGPCDRLVPQPRVLRTFTHPSPQHTHPLRLVRTTTHRLGRPPPPLPQPANVGLRSRRMLFLFFVSIVLFLPFFLSFFFSFFSFLLVFFLRCFRNSPPPHRRGIPALLRGRGVAWDSEALGEGGWEGGVGCGQGCASRRWARRWVRGQRQRWWEGKGGVRLGLGVGR